jgi:hypothetical protein
MDDRKWSQRLFGNGPNQCFNEGQMLLHGGASHFGFVAQSGLVVTSPVIVEPVTLPPMAMPLVATECDHKQVATR